MFEEFIKEYGYFAVFAFACIEGEIAVLTAGFLCAKGLMSLQYVVLYACLGTLFAEQGLYYVGHFYGAKVLNKHPNAKKKSQKVLEFLKKYDIVFIFFSRFIYGIRNISPLAVGISGIKPLKFSLVNIPAAMVWSVSVAGIGYVFSDFIDIAMQKMHNVHVLFLIMFFICVCIFMYKRKKNQRIRHKESNML